LRTVPACLLALLLSACAGGRSSNQSDWEKLNEGRLARETAEVAPELPPYPRQENLLEFFVSSASDFRFFVDRASIGVKDRIVRYTLVARSPNGVDNVSYEGINCPAGEYQVYALGGAERSWLSRPGPWREITPRSVQRWHNALYREFFCPNSVAISNAAEGIRALEQGGHPWAKLPDTAGGSR
jgi:CNP1-like family